MSIFELDKEKKITQKEKVIFNAKVRGIYLIEISARVKNRKQLDTTDDEDLKIEIDNNKFPFNDPAAFSGASLKGLKKIVYFLLPLNSGKHEIFLLPDISATVLDINVKQITSLDKVDLSIDNQAEDGNRREWITFVLINLSLSSFTVFMNLKRRFIDSDDVKVIIDNNVKRNTKSLLRKYWYFIASFLTGETQTEIFMTNFSSGTHYIEFWADRMPTMQKITFIFEEKNQKRIPTVDDPAWTGDFIDDSDQMILARAIFGEARSWEYPDQARIAVGWSIRNRVGDKRWHDTHQGVITEEWQYSAFNKTDDNRPYVENPLRLNDDFNKKAWHNCYKIAGKVINGELKDPTNGANHYYDNSIFAPPWATKETLVLAVKSTNNKSALIFHKL